VTRLLHAAVVAFLIAANAPLDAAAPDWVVRAGKTEVDAALLAARPSPDAAIVWRQQIVTAGKATGSTKLFYREAVKILTPAGVPAGTFRSSYDDDSGVDVEGAWTVHPDGSLDQLKLRDVVTIQLANPEYFTDTYVVTFRPPRLGPGDIAAYALSRKSRRDVYQWALPLQDDSPIVGEEVAIDLPDGWTHRWRLTRAPEGYSGPLTGEGGNRASYRFGPQHGWPEEILAPAGPDRFACLEISAVPSAGQFGGLAFRSWDEVAHWFEQRSRPARAPLAGDLYPRGPGDPASEAASWVQRSVRYVALEVGEGGYVPRSPSLVARRRFGDCKDKAFLLLALLARCGREALPVLTRPRSAGRIDPDFPTPVAFNHLVVAVRIPSSTGLPAEVRLRDGPAMIFDPTEESTPFGQLPGELQGGRGLVVRADGGELVEFPFAAPNVNRLTREVTGSIDTEGGLAATVREVTQGGLCERSRYRQQTVLERQESIARRAEKEVPGSRAENVAIAGIEDATVPVEARFSLSARGFLRRAGSQWALPTLPFGVGPARVPHLAERRMPIDLGFPKLEQVHTTLTLPAGFRVDAVSPPIEVANSYARYRYAVRKDSGRLLADEDFEVRTPIVPLSDRAAWKAIEDAASEARTAMVALSSGR
jgi:hypothetical protein